MRVIQVVDIISDSDETNDDTEPFVAVNPANPRLMVATAFVGPKTGSTLAPVFYSTDGGLHWTPNYDVPGGISADQTVSFATTSGELYIATLQRSNQWLNIDRTPDPTASNPFTNMVQYQTNAFSHDQPYICAISVTNGPDQGKDRLYVGYNAAGSQTGATVDVCLDALNASPSFTPVLLDSRTVSQEQNGPPVRPSAHSDGTVYAGYTNWRSPSGSLTNVDFVLTRDDNWGKNNFSDLKDPSDQNVGRIVVSSQVNESASLGNERVTGTGFDVQVDPNNSDIVYMCWHDTVGSTGTDTLHVRRSNNRGAAWSGDLITVEQAVLAKLAINSAGTVAFAYQSFVNSLWETHLQTTSDGSTWSDLVLARTALPTTGGQPGLGDFFGMVAIGPHFYGVFPSLNTPGPGNFLPNGEGIVVFNRNQNSTQTGLVGSDGVSAVPPSVDPFFFRVEEKEVTFLMVRNPISQDEVDARRKQGTSAGGLPIRDAFRVIVDGFTALDLEINSTAGTLKVPSPVSGMTITCTGNTADTGIYGTGIQRFTFFYEIDFPDDSTFMALTGESQPFPLAVTVGASPLEVPGSAILTLIKNPDPFILHGDTPWLSIDLRVFPVRAGGTTPNTNNPTTMGSSAKDAPTFIQNLMQSITPDQFDHMLSDEQASALYTQPVDESGDSVFNFALAKVHYIGIDPNPVPVQVFFRLFPAQTTSVDYDFIAGMSLNQPANYRRTTNPDTNQPVPLAGFQGNEYTTIPFFAESRIDSTVYNMNKQPDSHNFFAFNASADGSEVIHFFGCWLDINQPVKPDPNNPGSTISNVVLPAQVPATNIDGPFTDAIPIQSLIRGLHECLIAEVVYDPTPIPLNSNPGNWDKLAQRNIAWSDAGSATAVTTFDIKSTVANLPLGQTPDELMIDWGNTRSDSLAQIYLPAVSAVDVVGMAAHMYTPNRLTQVDDYTVGFPVGGISYIPIPPGFGINYAGLLTIDMPDRLHKGESFTVAISQLTNASGQLAPTPPPPPVPQIQTGHGIATPNAVSVPQTINWRRIIGSFQLTIPVRDKAAILPREEINLSVLRYIAQTIPLSSRWYPVFLRYVQVIAGRVTTFGGDPTTILPSPIGTGRRRPKPCPCSKGRCTCARSPCDTHCWCGMCQCCSKSSSDPRKPCHVCHHEEHTCRGSKECHHRHKSPHTKDRSCCHHCKGHTTEPCHSCEHIVITPLSHDTEPSLDLGQMCLSTVLQRAGLSIPTERMEGVRLKRVVLEIDFKEGCE